MTDPRLERMAQVIVDYSIQVRAGQLVLITSEPAGLGLACLVYRQALAAQAHPYVRVILPDLEALLLSQGSDDQVSYVSEIDRLEVEQADARVVVRAPENTRVLAGIDPSRLALARRARQPLFNRLLERKARGELATCLTQYPTAAAAQEAGMSLVNYEDFVFRACFCDQENPVQAWQELSREQQGYVNFLNTVRELVVEAPDTELKLSVAGRRWINSDGRANFPSGEVFTGPVEDSAEGHIRLDVPTPFSGHDVEGIELRFQAGRVVAARAERGTDFLVSTLDTDPGARVLGEFAFGLNYRIDRPTRNILFDEKIGGTIHLAVGSGYPETGSTNRSAIHWDMIKNMKTGRVLADGRTVYENGRFKL
ncbi:MAG: aminopeptidase [candidate division WOR-3 bacterium]